MARPGGCVVILPSLLLHTDVDFDYNEETEAPYFAATTENKPKPKKNNKKKKEVAEGAAAPLGEGLMEASQNVLPDDEFAAALAAATMVRPPSMPAAEQQQQQQAEQQAERQADEHGAVGAMPGQAISGMPPDLQPSDTMFAAAAAAQPQDVQQPAAAMQPAPSKPKFKIKLGGAAQPQPKPQREPSREPWEAHLVYFVALKGNFATMCTDLLCNWCLRIFLDAWLCWVRSKVMSLCFALIVSGKRTACSRLPLFFFHLPAFPAAEFLYDYTVGEEEEEPHQSGRRRTTKAKGGSRLALVQVCCQLFID